jgi:plastocyanin
VLACLLAVALAALAGCGSSGGSSSSGSTSAAAGGGTSSAVITIKDFTFTTPASVSPGATVTVHNMDSIAHSVTADTGNAFDSPAPPGDSSFKAPTTPGSYPFHCTPHPEMHGTLVVK